MALDNIIFYDELILNVDLTNVGSASNILFPAEEMLNINVVHTGSAESILFPQEIMETLSLICSNTYSRSRVVNK